MKGESTCGTAVKISRLKPEVGELRRERSGKSAVKITRRRLNVAVGTGQYGRERVHSGLEHDGVLHRVFAKRQGTACDLRGYGASEQRERSLPEFAFSTRTFLRYARR